MPPHTGLADARTAVDLGRFVLLDEVAANGGTWFLARAFRLLRQEKAAIEAVMSYSDAMPRRGPDGRIIKPGHVGLILQAHGGGGRQTLAYRGRSQARVELITPDGQPFSSRALSKIRGGEIGRGYAVDELVRRGAPAPASDDLRAWFDTLLANGFFARRRHPGNHVYAYALTRAARRAAHALPKLPFPALDPTPAAEDRTALPLFAAVARRGAASD